MNSDAATENPTKPFLPLPVKVLLIVLVVVAAGYGFSRAKGSQRKVETYTVGRGDISVSVVAGSTAASLAPHHVKVEVREGATLLRVVEEGYLVTRDDIANRKVLAEFDSAGIERRIRDYELYYQSAIAAFANSQQALEVMGKVNESLIQNAQRKVKFSSMDLRKYLGEALASELIDKVSRQRAAVSAREGLQQAIAEEAEARTAAEQAAQRAAEARPPGRATTAPDASADTVLDMAVASSLPGAGEAPSDSQEFDEGFQPVAELEADAAIAAETAVVAARRLDQARKEFDAAVKALGMDPASFEGDPNDWSIAFEPVDFHALAKDPRLGGAAALEREKLRTEIMLDQEELLMAQKALQGSVKLFENDFIPETELQKEQLSYDRKKTTLELKNEKERLFFLYDFPKAAEQAFAEFGEALSSLDRTRRTAQTRLIGAQAGFLSSMMRLQYREESLHRYYRHYTEYNIHASTEGLLIYGESGSQNQRYDEQVREGMYVREGMTLFTIPDLSSMAFRMKLHESVIDKVTHGQRAHIRVEAYPDELVEGEISKVAVLPSSASSYFNPELRVYDVTVTVTSAHDWLRPGMTAEVRIMVDELSDVLLVPLEAVTTRGNEAICYLPTGERRVVQTGLFNDTHIEIRQGLQEGDTILRDPRPFLENIDDGSGEINLWLPETKSAATPNPERAAP